jgi:hypothetical protein
MELGQPFFWSSAHRRGVTRCGVQPSRPSGAPTLTIKAELVRNLRTGLRSEIAGTLDVLRAHIEDDRVPVDKSTYRAALADLDNARALLDTIGLDDDADGRDVELDSERWRGLVSRVMNSQYELETSRLADLAADGFPLRRKGHVVHALAEQVAQLPAANAASAPGRAPTYWPRRPRGSQI